MVSSVSQTQILPKTTKTSIFYINDVHSSVSSMPKIKASSDSFDAQSPENVDKLKFSAGDFALGQDPKLYKVAVATQNSMNLMATAGGNHEFDLTKKDLVDVLKDNNYKILGINVEVPETTEENKQIKKEITSSYIQEVNGTKYGVIGVMPFDFIGHVTDSAEYSDFNIISIEKAIPRIQAEVDKMKEQGINKVILLSHAGYTDDVELAQSVEGIDVILGGHSHDLIKGVQEGKNLFYSAKTGEPTIITQAGKDGRYFGVLNLEFNDNGVITNVQNNVTPTENFPKSMVVKFFTDAFLGKAEEIGHINSVENHSASLIKENPSADYIADAIRNELNVDIAIINSGNMRGKFEQGSVTDRDLAGITPFKNKMYVINLTEPEVVNAIKVGAKSLVDSEYMPGIAQVSGLKYTINKSGDLLDLKFVDKEGKETQIDITNPNPFKTYTAGEDFFLVRGGNGYFPSKLEDYVQKFDFDKDKLVVDYMKKQTEPIEIKSDGRIQIVD